MPTANDLIEHLKRNYKPGTPIAYILWTPADVQGVAGQILCNSNDEESTLTDDEIAEVLGTTYAQADASTGITWETIRVNVDQVIAERE